MSMFRWSPAEVTRALGVEPRGRPPSAFTRVGTDTRSIEEGSLFVALSGERFDAHDFLGRAAEAGARGAVVSRIPEDAPPDLAYFVVEDTLTALGRLGRHRRMAFSGPVVAVTGTNGKTTTKELLKAALSRRYRVHATEGNLNNQVGVPLTLLAIPDDAEVLIVEMGMNEPGEIAVLATIGRPTIGVVTGVSAGHLERLGSVHNVLIEKTSLIAALPAGATAVVGDDPPELPERARALTAAPDLRVAGFSGRAEYRPDGGIEGVRVLDDGATEWSWRGVPVRLGLSGRHQARNAALALAVAEALEVPVEAAVEGISSMPAPSLRGEWRQIGGLRVIADCYNANPASMDAAIDLVATLPGGGGKVAVVGSMAELGEHEARLHRESARSILDRLGSELDLVVATGAFVEAFRSLGAEDERVVLREDPVEAFEAAAGRLRGEETVLLKASRSQALERWIGLMEARWGKA